jgi:hypothetical protein
VACRSKAIQELLEHATIEMMMRYAHLSPNVPRDAVKLLDQGGRLGNGWAKTEKSNLCIRIVVEAPGVEPGSGSAPLMPLRACPAI